MLSGWAWLYIALSAIGLAPFYLDILQAFVPALRLRLGRRVQLILGPWNACMILVGLALCGYYFWTVFVPLIADPLLSLVHQLTAGFLLVQTGTHFVLAVMANPGYADKTRTRPRNASEHYCVHCERVVSQHDHHCPFTANCVGRGTFRYFYLTLVYGLFGALFCSYHSFGLFRDCVWSMAIYHSRTSPSALQHSIVETLNHVGPSPVCRYNAQLGLEEGQLFDARRELAQCCAPFATARTLFIPSVLVGVCGVSLLLSFHTILLVVGKTTRELLGRVKGGERPPLLAPGESILALVFPWM